MSKILEVIGKNNNLKSNISELTLLDTNFNSVGKVLGNDDTLDWENITNGDLVCLQVFRSLYQSQKLFFDRFDNFKTEYNSWVNSTIPKVPSLINLEHSMDFTDWSADYQIDITTLDYSSVLTDVADSERILYETTFDKTQNNFIRNKVELQNWSKDKNYGSCVNEVESGQIVMNDDFNFNDFTITTSVSGVSARFEFVYGTNNKFIVNGLANVPVGGNVVIEAKADASGTGDDNILRWTINRTALGNTIGNDDGTLGSGGVSYEGEDVDHFSNGFTIKNYTGNYSPHFETNDNTHNELNLNWFKTRILL
jgi:hypothetical protein